MSMEAIAAELDNLFLSFDPYEYGDTFESRTEGYRSALEMLEEPQTVAEVLQDIIDSDDTESAAQAARIAAQIERSATA